MIDDTMMNAEQIWRAVATERTTLAQMLETLPESEWDSPSLCDGWRIRDIVAHVVLSSHASIGSILVNLIRARGNLARTIKDTAIRHADRRPTRLLLDELRDSIDARVTVVGTTPADRLMDLLVHGQDIAIPLGINREMPIPAARLALERVWTMGPPFHARAALGNYRLSATDTEWSRGEGPIIEGSTAALLLLTTGRNAASGLVIND